MTQFYSDVARENDNWTLPDCEVFERTAREVAEGDEELVWQYMKRPEFRLAAMNSRDRERMIDAIIEEEGITGGWYYWYCLPGCLPDSEPSGPFASQEEAISAARDDADNDEEEDASGTVE